MPIIIERCIHKTHVQCVINCIGAAVSTIYSVINYHKEYTRNLFSYWHNKLCNLKVEVELSKSDVNKNSVLNADKNYISTKIQNTR